MAHNSLYPGFVRLRYAGLTLSHTMTLPVIEDGTASIGDEPKFTVNFGASKDMSDAVDELVTLLKPVHGTNVTYIDAEYWQFTSPEVDPYWVFTHPVGEPGTSGTQSVQQRQEVKSFRTNAGGIFRSYIMNITGATADNIRQSYPWTGVPQNLAAYLIGNGGWVVGRDGGRLVTGIWRTTKTNDANRRKVFDI